jgi:hypothetical protein
VLRVSADTLARLALLQVHEARRDPRDARTWERLARTIECVREAHDARVTELLAANSREVERRRVADGCAIWLPMADAPRDGTRILLKLKDPIPDRPDMLHFGGLPFVGRHPGIVHLDGLRPRFDPGWNFGAPVGMGGFPDEWLVGWRPIP